MDHIAFVVFIALLMYLWPTAVDPPDFGTQKNTWTEICIQRFKRTIFSTPRLRFSFHFCYSTYGKEATFSIFGWFFGVQKSFFRYFKTFDFLFEFHSNTTFRHGVHLRYIIISELLYRNLNEPIGPKTRVWPAPLALHCAGRRARPRWSFGVHVLCVSKRGCFRSPPAVGG